MQIEISENKKKEYISSMSANLKVLRTKAGYTQKQLSELIGVSLQTYVNAEKHGNLNWNTYLSLMFVFDNIAKTNTEMAGIMECFGVFPEEYKTEKLVSIEREEII